jgi:ABC-2 type transport system permease protein
MTNRILVALKGEIRGFWRSKSTLFFTVAFPLLLILLFGAIFSAQGTGSFDLPIQDLSNSPASHQFIAALNATGAINIKTVNASANLDQYIKDNSPGAVLIIPADFQNAFAPGASVNATELVMRLDPTSTSSNTVLSIVSSIANQFNLGIAGGANVITLAHSDITVQKFNYIDFFLPGVIAMTSMTTTIFWMVSIMTRYRTNGIFKKLTTTPITRGEWLASQILMQLIVVWISVAIIIVFGMALFNVHVTLTPLSIAVIMMSGAAFSSLGMVIARFIKEEEGASAAANAITFPMMFLAGIFFPLSMFPSWLASIANVLPLTYVGNALRDSMIYGNEAAATSSALVVLGFFVVLFVAGILSSKWRTE